MPLNQPPTDANLSTSDITTNDASTTKHGFLLKLNNSSTQFVNGQGAWATPGAVGGGTYTAPAFRAAGASAAGTGAVVPGLPAGHTTNDILILAVQSSNETVTAPADWAQLGPTVGFGTAATAASVRLSLFWKRHDGSESDPTVADPGDHAVAQIIAVSGCVTTGDPFLCIGTARLTTAGTTGTASAGATPLEQCMVVNVFAHGLDSASAVYSVPVNADLNTPTEQADVATADGTGGGFGIITGIATTAKSFAATTVTQTSTTGVSSTFLLLPAGITERQGFVDTQVFRAPGFADTWTRPTAAKLVAIRGIGGGAGGSAGRNAATAAGGGGGGGGMYDEATFVAALLPATLTVTPGAGGAATANSDGASSNAGVDSTVSDGSRNIFKANGGNAAGASATGSGGLGGNGGGRVSATAASTVSFTSQQAGGGTGGTTAGSGAPNAYWGGGAGAGGGTNQATSAAGAALRGGGGGGGGRASADVGTGGGSIYLGNILGGATAGANGVDSPYPDQYGGSGAAGGTSAAGPGGTGGWPGGGGGGGGSQSGAQRGGAGGDGVTTITTIC